MPVAPGTDDRWAVTPKHHLRWRCVQDAVADWEPCRLVEFGAGTAEFTARLATSGFEVVCWDPGEQNREAARARISRLGLDVVVVDEPPPPVPAYDALAAFEVLEHVEDDQAVLADWVRRLRPGGRVVVSVPAHMRAWSRDDERVGHVRRYERPELVELLSAAGLGEIEVRCWGFPLGNVTRQTNRLVSKLERRDDLDGADAAERSEISGRRRSGAAARASSLVTPTTMRPFEALQRRFFGADLGDGFVATARLPG